MSRLRFSGKLNLEAWRSHGILPDENLILLAYFPEAKARVRKELIALKKKNEELEAQGKESIELDVEINILYKPRSLNANRLMFKLYNVIAEMLNAEAKTMNKITADELYEKDMEDWAAKHQIKCDNISLPFVVEILEQEKGHVKNKSWDGDNWVLEIWQTSSYWNTKQQSEHIDRLFSTIESMGRNRINNGDLAVIYDDFKKWKKKEDIQGEGSNN